MPELPEVETTLQGICPHVKGKLICQVQVRNPSLRWPVPPQLPDLLKNQRVMALFRRAKYLLLKFETGHLLLHLGMSGSLRIVNADAMPEKHDHLDFVLESGCALRFTDPRRFGAVLWLEGDPLQHPLLKHLGPEPFESIFDGNYLYQRSRGKRVPVKTFLMDNKVVVGVGNIYANEVLFRSGIRPDREAGRISRQRYQRLAAEVVQVLTEAIKQGGTTLKDFVGGDGKPGYFKQQLSVYGRGGASCMGCGKPLVEIRLGQRSTVYCKYCQR